MLSLYNMNLQHIYHIYFMGPFPRHLLRCCEDENHIIRGPSDETVNMINYTAFSTFMERSPGIVQDRILFIHYQAIFGNDFTSKILTDGVHLNNEVNLMFANFILSPNFLNEPRVYTQT